MNRHSEAREFTRRSLLTGVLIGAVLTPCNVYSGLKIGWSFNMSIVAALLAYGFWNLGARRLGARPFGLLENNINQTTASSAASSGMSKTPGSSSSSAWARCPPAAAAVRLAMGAVAAAAGIR